MAAVAAAVEHLEAFRALRLRGRYWYRRIQMLAIRIFLSVIFVARKFDLQSLGVGIQQSPSGGFVAFLCAAVLGTGRPLPVSCFPPKS